MHSKLFSRDFTLVVIGQIISLFGNAALRFALPLYLLNLTGSSALYGTVMACALIPTVLMSPVGGMIADRVNKRNIMVALDFFTALVIAVFSVLMNGVNLVVLLTVTLMLLFGIAGAYQPAVQASIPALVCQEHFMAANSIINTISSFAALIGPVIGGILYSAYGLKPILWVCMVCFFISAVMELFIQIPFLRQVSEGSVWKLVKSDFADSIRFIRKDKPAIGKAVWIVCGINLFLSAMISVGVPYLITEVIDIEASLANRLYGFTEGAMAAGGLTGGICAGVFGNKLSVHKSCNLLIAGAMGIFPVAAVLLLFPSGMVNYLVLTVCCFGIMIVSTIFSIQMISFFQRVTPQNIIGKVIAVIMMTVTCAQPLGNALYGVLFEICKGYEYAVVLFAGAVSLIISASARKIFSAIE